MKQRYGSNDHMQAGDGVGRVGNTADNKAFAAVLSRQEEEDLRQASSGELFKAAVLNEFSNGAEILEKAKSLAVTPEDFLSGKVASFPITPVRRSSRFCIKKHTESQTPYFHGHEFYELIYAHRGRCLQHFPDGSELCLQEGESVLLAPGEVHMIEKNRLRSDITLKLAIPEEMYKRTGGRFFEERFRGGRQPFGKASGTAAFAILKLLERNNCDGRFGDMVVESYLTIIFAELASAAKRDEALETEIYGYFCENIADASLSDFAKRKNYNPDYLSRKIKERTGKNFSELLDMYRMDIAKRLLTETDRTVEDIAREAGYSGTSGMYKRFSALSGMKPGEYRRLLK